jgi:hypothetical protein
LTYSGVDRRRWIRAIVFIYSATARLEGSGDRLVKPVQNGKDPNYKPDWAYRQNPSSVKSHKNPTHSHFGPVRSKDKRQSAPVRIQSDSGPVPLRRLSGPNPRPFRSRFDASGPTLSRGRPGPAPSVPAGAWPRSHGPTNSETPRRTRSRTGRLVTTRLPSAWMLITKKGWPKHRLKIA